MRRVGAAATIVPSPSSAILAHCRATSGPPRLFRRSPRKRLWGTIHQARPAAVAHFASSSARLSFPTAISTIAAAATKFGCRQPIVVDPKYPERFGHARRPAAPQLLSRSPPRASRADFLPKVPAAQAVNFACRLKTRVNPLQTGGNRAQTGGKNSQNS